jgi:hypothetical protein
MKVLSQVLDQTAEGISGTCLAETGISPQAQNQQTSPDHSGIQLGVLVHPPPPEADCLVVCLAVQDHLMAEEDRLLVVRSADQGRPGVCSVAIDRHLEASRAAHGHRLVVRGSVKHQSQLNRSQNRSQNQ